jgi:hypothetical protein
VICAGHVGNERPRRRRHENITIDPVLKGFEDVIYGDRAYIYTFSHYAVFYRGVCYNSSTVNPLKHEEERDRRESGGE